MRNFVLASLAFALLSSCTKEGDAIVVATPQPPPVSVFSLVQKDILYTDTAYLDSLVGRKLRTLPGVTYSFSVLNAVEYSFSVSVYTSIQLGQPVMSIGSHASPWEGTFTATDSLCYIVIEGLSLMHPALPYQVIIHEFGHLSPEINQGTWTSPIAFSGNTFYTGTVDTRGTSYYLISGLVPSANYHMCLYSMTGDVDMNAHYDNTFTMQYNATLNHTDVTSEPEVYVIPADPSGKAYISVDGGELNQDASTFRLLLFL